MPKWVKLNNVKGSVKSYSEDLKNRYDEPIRQKLKEIFGDILQDNPDPYQQDFIINCEECRFRYLEVQVCVNWITKYPYDKVFVFARKFKYGDDTLYLTVSKHLDRGFLFNTIDLKDIKPRRLKKYSRELVYDIPWEKILNVDIDHMDEFLLTII